MPAHLPLFHEVHASIQRATIGQRLRATTIDRLALLVTGIMVARSCVLLKVARELDDLGLTNATENTSIARRLSRIVGDPHLTAAACYTPLLRHLIPWREPQQSGTRVVVIVDESSKGKKVHLLRASLAYRGCSIPLSWVIWKQNVPLDGGEYWQSVDTLLTRVAAILPPGLDVVVLADRAYDVPAFIDRITAHGWHWIVRCRAQGSMRVLDHQGREASIAELTDSHLATPGRRWKMRGRVFKNAGWRDASIVGIWERTAKEPLVVLTDLEPRWEVLSYYGRRFWTEPAFKTDKSAGWQWEDSQVRDLEHQDRLLLAMAWASVLTLLLGAKHAGTQRTHLTQRRRRRPGHPPKPQHATESLFTQGLNQIKRWAYRRTRGRLPRRLHDITAPTWDAQWCAHQSRLFIAQTVHS